MVQDESDLLFSVLLAFSCCTVSLQYCFEMVNDTLSKRSRLNLFLFVHGDSALLPHYFHQQALLHGEY